MVEQPTFSECAEITDDSPIRQGDVIQWLNAEEDPWRALGVIVTADCDIAHEKHRGILSYVPLLAVIDYLGLMWLPNRLDRICKPYRESIISIVRRNQADNLPSFTKPISESEVLRWIATDRPDEIANTLQIPHGKDRDQFNQNANDFLRARNVLEAGSSEAMLEVLLNLRMKQVRKPENAVASTRIEVRDHLRSLPGDAFFIGSLGNHHQRGYIAYLRVLREVQEAEIAIKQPDLSKPTVRAKRISRLKSPYVYQMTKQLADVFSAIGLPVEYEENRDDVSLRLINHP